MPAIFAAHAFLPQGWSTNVRVTLDGGRIGTVAAESEPGAGDERCSVLLPGMPNLHSHAFQRAMAGLTERRGPTADSFWTWRDQMYRFALTMTPDDVEAVAAQLYVEMLEAGFTRVGEFHYLHHDRDGRPYGRVGEMAERIVAACATTGLGLTLLPVFYAHAGFGGIAPSEGQRRFICDLDTFENLFEACGAAISRLPGAVLGVAPHSLRAVTEDELARIVELAKHRPIHIHVAEQTSEVEASLAYSGQRPVERLLAHAPVDGRWCLIHATHMTPDETDAAARTGAVAGLCPVTEANLGDGVFDAPGFLGAGGRFGIGSDSNVRIGIPAELATLEYSQRLTRRLRNVIAPKEGSTGETLYAAALTGGWAALGAEAGGLVSGGPADLVTLERRHDLPIAPDSLFDEWIFAGAYRVDTVRVAGESLVSGGRHRDREAVARRFAQTMRSLLTA